MTNPTFPATQIEIEVDFAEANEAAVRLNEALTALAHHGNPEAMEFVAKLRNHFLIASADSFRRAEYIKENGK